MFLRKIRWIAAALAALLLLARPEDAANAARMAMAQWAHAVAPALFPFMALLPLLTGPDAARVYERTLGGFTRRILNLPGAAAPALVAGWVAGSPAGALAARRAAAGGALTRGELRRVACAMGGLSPAFLLGGVGAGLLGSPALGGVLARAQAAAQLTTLLLLRRAWTGDRLPVPPLSLTAEEQPVRGAVLSALTVCGYMTLFSAVGGALRAVASPIVGDALLCLADAPSGARVVAELPWETPAKLALMGAVTGFGGLCVIAQNLAALRGCGVPVGAFLAARCASGAMTAAFAVAQLKLPSLRVPLFLRRPFETAALCAAAMAIPTVIALKRRAARKGHESAITSN